MLPTYKIPTQLLQSKKRNPVTLQCAFQSNKSQRTVNQKNELSELNLQNLLLVNLVYTLLNVTILQIYANILYIIYIFQAPYTQACIVNTHKKELL